MQLNIGTNVESKILVCLVTVTVAAIFWAGNVQQVHQNVLPENSSLLILMNMMKRL